MTVRVFYVIYIEDGLEKDCIEAIRLLCNPFEKTAAHLTVRGPHGRKIIPNIWNKKLEGNHALINGVDRFFGDGQNTVFFRCSSPRLGSVWYKPDFDFNPHITIYDGPDRLFAEEVYGTMSNYGYRLSFKADRLEPLVSVKGQKGMALNLMDQVRLSELIHERFDLKAIANMSNYHKLTIIDRLCQYLSIDSSKKEETIQKEQSIKQMDLGL
jgi:hypothetical protein